MKASRRVLFAAVVLGIIVTASCSGGPEPGALIEPQEAFDLVQNGEAILVDVRDGASYTEAHLAGALLVPLVLVPDSADRLAAQDRTLITYCSCPAEETSAAAAGELIARGVDDVLVLKGGIRAWALEGLPLRSGSRP